MKLKKGENHTYVSKTKISLCKNYGCSRKRKDGSAYCQKCSEKYNNLINNFKNMEPDAMDLLHDFRKEIDASIKKADSFKSHSESEKFIREVSLVKTKLQEAKMWAGKCLEQIGSQLPAEFRDEAK